MICIVNMRFYKLTLTALALFLLAASNISAAIDIRSFIQDVGIFDPDKGVINIRYQLFKDVDTIEIRSQDFRGQIVSRHTLVELRAGDHTFSWDGKDSNGKRLPDGRYQLIFEATYGDGGQESIIVNTRIAAIKTAPGVQIPEPLPPETHKYAIDGSLASFYRHEDSDQTSASGEVRLRTNLKYADETTSARATFSALQDFDGNDPSYNGTQAMLEQRWATGRAKAVFREGLGHFNDPMQLFSDFKTERNKFGLTLEQNFGLFKATAIAYDTEGDVDNKEQGMAARASYGNESTWLLGLGYTVRNGKQSLSDETGTSQAVAVDLSFAPFDSLKVALEGVGTRSDDDLEDYGYLIRAEYDLGQIRLAASYIDLGEEFKAHYANPLHNVESDAKGVEVSADYYMPQQFLFFSSLSASARYFNLTRHSNDEELQEFDGSLRFSIGKKDTFFFSVFSRKDDFGDTLSTMGNASHKWNDKWSSRIQGNYMETDTSTSIRASVDTSYRQGKNAARLALEWSEREIDYSNKSPYRETHLRFDVTRELWRLQLQGKYSENSSQSGYNFFGRIEYKPCFLHRYNIITYASIGSRSAFEFEERIEVGLEVRF